MTYESPIKSKKDKVKKVLTLINEIQIQDSWSSDEESDTVTPNSASMVVFMQENYVNNSI
jgi:hypothetical protein